MLPDLAIDPAGISILPKSPADGETIFFTVPTLNKGGGNAAEL